MELEPKERSLQKLKIELKKNIPPGSGLGGGSSNAACVLKGLKRLYKLNIQSRDLIKIGTSIGADVPFFINGIFSSSIF